MNRITEAFASILQVEWVIDKPCFTKQSDFSREEDVRRLWRYDEVAVQAKLDDEVSYFSAQS